MSVRGTQYFWNSKDKKWISREEMIKLRESQRLNKEEKALEEVMSVPDIDKNIITKIDKFDTDGKDGMELRWDKIKFLKEHGEEVNRSTSNDKLDNLIKTKYS